MTASLPRSCTEAHARRSRLPTIRNDPREDEPVEQGQRLRAIVPLARRQADPQGMAYPIDGEVNLATEASATAAEGVLPPFFVRLLHTDARARSCCHSSRVPGRDPRPTP